MRISRNQMYMEIARTVSKRSTCHRLNVGAVLVVDNRVVSTGYNGPASGEPHCFGNDCPLSCSGGCSRSIHAEANAIDFLQDGSLNGEVSIYVTHSPCMNCAKLIKTMGIDKVFYETAYRDTSSLDWLISEGVKVYRYSPSGYLINHSNNKVEELV